MAKRKIIPKDPRLHKNYFVVDANFLAFVAIPRKSKRHKFIATPENEKERAARCIKWWQEIKRQLKEGKAKVYIPDICIAEAFKVLAKWYYKKKWFPDAESHNRARKRLRSFVAISHEEMAKATRTVGVHDVPTNRDIVIAVDRFFEIVFKQRYNVQIPDLILLATAKYLIDYYDIPREHLYILTCDKGLMEVTRAIKDIPTAIDPTDPRYEASKTFK